MTVPPDEKRCEEKVHDEGRAVTFHRCYNKAKGEHDGKRLCALHLRMIERRRKRAEEYDRRTAHQEDVKERMQTICDLLALKGIDAHPYYRTGGSLQSGGYADGQVVISTDDLMEVLGAEPGECPGHADDEDCEIDPFNPCAACREAGDRADTEPEGGDPLRGRDPDELHDRGR